MVLMFCCFMYAWIRLGGGGRGGGGRVLEGRGQMGKGTSCKGELAEERAGVSEAIYLCMYMFGCIHS